MQIYIILFKIYTPRERKKETKMDRQKKIIKSVLASHSGNRYSNARSGHKN
jgi:hypothetical protein